MYRIAYNIKWETDGNIVDLPNEVSIPNEIDDDCITDYLSDEYGYLIESYALYQIYDKFNVGDKVKWHDVAIDDFWEDKEIQENRIYEVVNIINDDVVMIADEYGEAEVYTSELEVIE
jgi:hypothetical protein